MRYSKKAEKRDNSDLSELYVLVVNRPLTGSHFRGIGGIAVAVLSGNGYAVAIAKSDVMSNALAARA